jgi:hypothetical protein
MKKTLREQISALDYSHRWLTTEVAVKAAFGDESSKLIEDYADGVAAALATLRALEPVQDEMRDVIRKSRGK